MPRFLTLLLLFLIGIPFVRNVDGGGFRYQNGVHKVSPEKAVSELTKPKPKHAYTLPHTVHTVSRPVHAVPHPIQTDNPKPDPSSEANEANKEKSDYDDIVDAVQSISDAISNNASLTTTSASLSPQGSSCFQALHVYNECVGDDEEDDEDEDEDEYYNYYEYADNFQDSPFAVQAYCLCYTYGDNNLSTWAPTYYDGLISGCYPYLQTQTQYPISQVTLRSDRFSLCAMVGDVAATTSTSPPTTTSAATPSPSPAQSSPTPTTATPPQTVTQSSPAPTTASATRNVGSGSLIAIMGLWLGGILI